MIPRSIALPLLAAGTCLGQNCTDQWLPGYLGPGFDQPISAMILYDTDGPGPAPPELYAGGDFLHTPDGPARGLARWDGAHWKALPSELFHAQAVKVLGLTRWDPDGPGPARELLITFGTFTSAGDIPVNGLAAWDGAAWSPIGDPAARVTAATSWDPDGPGPLTPQLVIATRYPSLVRQWTGSNWVPVGEHFWSDLNFPLGLYTLASYDPDGNGPSLPQLFVGGTFDHCGATNITILARWDGAAWRRVLGETLLNSYCGALYTFDLDGPGPEPECLAAAIHHEYGAKLFVTLQSRWKAFEMPFDFNPACMTLFDPDGSGPRPARLAIGGAVYAGPIQNVLWWDGASVKAFSTGLDGQYQVPTVASLVACQPPDGGPPRLAAGGAFHLGSNHISKSFALWTCAPAPCYPNCDASTTAPILTINDFICFLTRFAAADPYANCDASTTPPLLNVNDLVCFITRFAAGCPS